MGSSMKITWDPSACSPANNPLEFYLIYRKNNCAPFSPDPCVNGVDPLSGFVLIGQTNTLTTVFVDNNGGNGLVVGQDYSYLVVGAYHDGTRSFAGTTVCAKLKRDIPVILNADVLSTSAATGSLYIRWARPLITPGNFDSIAFPGPYTFNLKYRPAGAGAFTTVFTSSNTVLHLLATEYFHTGLNTVNTGHEYQVEFIAGTYTIGSSQKAGSEFLTTLPGDRKVELTWKAITPWDNYTYSIYRKNPASNVYTFLATTTATTYTDQANLKNRAQYCYKVLAEGQYSDPSIVKPLLNNSQEACAAPVDLVLPCPPVISIDADCSGGPIKLKWTNEPASCNDDVIKYVLYKKETVDGEYTRLDTIYGYNSTTFVFDGANLVSSCYAIQAVDSSGNGSPVSPDYCVDNCP